MNADITLVNVNLMFAVTDGSVDFQVYAPLGLLYIAASLEKEGYKVDFRDYQLFVKQNMQDPFNLESFCHFMEGAADIVGLSCMSNLLPFTLLAAKYLKERNPQTTLVLGGVGPTGVAQEIVENFDWIDFVCYGEGERSILDLMAYLKAGAKDSPTIKAPIPGFFVRQDGRACCQTHPRIADLDTLPFPAYHLIDFKDYDAALSVITSRGCTYRCTFCTETNHWNNRVVFRGIDSVIEEIRQIKKYSPKRVFLFQDDQITASRGRAQQLFKALISEKMNLHWKSFVRVDLIDDELLGLMSEAGCIQVRFGIESGSNEVLKTIKKGFTIEQAYRAVLLALEHIPSVHASFIWGYPFETIDQCKETIRWIRRFQDVGCTVLNFLLSPLPNSEIYRNYRGPLDFNEHMMANFNCSGGENFTNAGTQVLENSTSMFEFIQKYPKVFPGFYLYDYRNNIAPKMRLMHKARRISFRGMKTIRVDDYDLVDL